MAKSIGINDETMLTIKLTTKRLKKHDLKSVKHLAIFGESKVSVTARKIQETSFIIPLSRNI